jgi:hypothetical protein
VPADEPLLLVVPDLADVVHLAAALGDAVVVQDQVKHLARPRLHAVQQARARPRQQRRGVPVAAGEEHPVARAVPAGRRQRREVQQLGRPQVHRQAQHQAPEMTELVVGQGGAKRAKEALRERRQAGENHGSALRGAGDSFGKTNHPA